MSPLSFPPPKKGGWKTQNGRFPSKIALHLKKVCYKVSLCENCQRKWLVGRGGVIPSTWNFGSNWLRWSEIDNFRSLFTRIDSAVTPSEKSSINTNRKSTARFSMSPGLTSYVVPEPQRVAQKRKVSEIWTISCDNAVTVRDRMSVTINH